MLAGYARFCVCSSGEAVTKEIFSMRSTNRFLPPPFAAFALCAATVALTAAFPVVSFAQETVPARILAAPPESGVSQATADPIAGPIRISDTVRVLVAGADYLTGDYRVDADGSVTIPRVGQIRVANLMQTKAAASIARSVRLARLLKAPDVSVYIVARKAREARVNGAVKTPGLQKIKDDTYLAEVLEAAAINPDADLSRVTISRGAEKIVVDYKKYQAGSGTGPEFNPSILDGDRIYVFAGVTSEGIVSVGGEVKDATKGLIPITAGTTVGQLLQQVGGLTDYADRSGIVVTRGQETIPVAYDDILKNIPGKDITLKDKDAVYIPRLEKPRQFSVIGAVREAKAFPLLTKVTLLEAVSQAGGVQEGGKQDKVELRRTGANGKIQTTTYDLHKDVDASIEIADGDVVSVPFGKRPGGIGIGETVGILSGIAVLFGQFRR